MQVDMEILSGEIYDTMRASHNEIRNRMENDDMVDDVGVVVKHLLQTPPSSPGGLVESPPATRALQEKFKKMEYPKLLKNNEELHRCMQDLVSPDFASAGIRSRVLA
jgi:hypothetical protein